jgi:hypothetical protein
MAYLRACLAPMEVIGVLFFRPACAGRDPAKSAGEAAEVLGKSYVRSVPAAPQLRLCVMTSAPKRLSRSTFRGRCYVNKAVDPEIPETPRPAPRGTLCQPMRGVHRKGPTSCPVRPVSAQFGVRRSVERARKGLWLTAASCGRRGTKSRGLTCCDRQCGIVRKPLLAARSLTPIIYIMSTSVEEGLP